MLCTYKIKYFDWDKNEDVEDCGIITLTYEGKNSFSAATKELERLYGDDLISISGLKIFAPDGEDVIDAGGVDEEDIDDIMMTLISIKAKLRKEKGELKGKLAKPTESETQKDSKNQGWYVASLKPEGENNEQ